MVLAKHDIEQALHAEHQEISAGRLKEDNPLDLTDDFRTFCDACRRGDLKVCHEKISGGVNINARDTFDYTPLILASLCGHYEVVQLLLDAGALCERDTFQGERCLYNALNDRIRNLLLAYDYSKSTDPLQPLAAHISSVLTREHPKTTDLALILGNDSFNVHKFILAARSPYFARKLAQTPEITSFRLPNSVPIQSIYTAIRFLYLSEVSMDLGDDEEEKIILTGIDKFSRQIEIERLFEVALDRTDKRLTRQRMTDEVSRGRDEMCSWFEGNVLKNKISVDAEKAKDVKWDRNNAIFADVLLLAEEDPEDEERQYQELSKEHQTSTQLKVIPIGPNEHPSRSTSPSKRSRKAVLFPAHRAMLLRSEFFLTMFGSAFREAQETQHLQIVPVDCSPEVLEIVLTFLYTEKADFPLEVAIDVLFAADLLFIEKLKAKAAVVISSLANGTAMLESSNFRGEMESEDLIDIFDVIRAGWATRVPRLEEFGARYIANRLENYIDSEDFAILVKESAGRIRERQETDTVELVDDIRYYLSDRFRLRFEDAGLEELMDEMEEADILTAQGDSLGLEKKPEDAIPSGVIRTLDGEDVGDEFEEDARNYQILLNKIDTLLERLDLDA